MTEQIPDTCRIDGKMWLIESWKGAHWVIPTTEQIWDITGNNFDLQSNSSANWSGRIDHYVIENGTLYLFKVEVNLAETIETLEFEIVDADSHLKLEPDPRLPSGYRIEEITLFQPMQKDDKSSYWATKINRILFEDLMIPYSGKLYLYRSCEPTWEMPLSIDFDESNEERLTITLDRGMVI